MFRTFSTVFMVLALTAPAIAAEPGGTVTGTIGGHQVELSISPGQSDYDGNLEQRLITGSLMIFDRALAEWNLGTVSISFEAYDLLNDGFGYMEVSVDINDMSPARTYIAEYSAYGEYVEENPIAPTLISVTEADNLLTISGRVAGTLTSVERIGRRNPDPDDTLEIDLIFDAVVAHWSRERE